MQKGGQLIEKPETSRSRFFKVHDEVDLHDPPNPAAGASYDSRSSNGARSDRRNGFEHALGRALVHAESGSQRCTGARCNPPDFGLILHERLAEWLA